jgi:hypothetical protein
VARPTAMAVGLQTDRIGSATDSQDNRQPAVISTLIEPEVRHAMIDERPVVHLRQLTLMPASVFWFALTADEQADVDSRVRSSGELPVEDDDRGLAVDHREEEVVAFEVVVHQREGRPFEEVLENLAQMM